jgi:hypothetical protein
MFIVDAHTIAHGLATCHVLRLLELCVRKLEYSHILVLSACLHMPLVLSVDLLYVFFMESLFGVLGLMWFNSVLSD